MTTTSIGDPLVGAVLDGRYQILQRLARGGMATVYRATDMRLGRVVAVKVMHDGLGEDEDFSRKFDREARSAAKLCHPNVVGVFDQGHDVGRAYIVMEYVEGCTLRNVISADTPMDPQKALELIDLILAALCAAHENGLVHRDIKPENVLISDRGQLKVADFGLARAISAHTATATQGVLIGTVSYLPPELVLHGKADTRSDVYSTGVVLFELLTGTKPYKGETPIQVAYAHVHNRIPAPSTRLDTSWQVSRNGIPPYLDALVRAATQREPDRRPHDAREFRSMTRRALDALSHGVMDDPALTAAFSAKFVDLEDTAPHDYEGPIELEEYVPEAERDAEESRGSAEIRERGRREWAGTQAVGAVRSPRSARSPQSPPTTRQPAMSRTPEREVHEDRPRGRHAPPGTIARRRRMVALVLLVVLTLTGGGVWWTFDGRFVATPAVAGMPQATAVETAEGQGLGVQINEAFSETEPAGVVISTEPAAGADIDRGGTVAITVSKGPERFAMPRVIGMSKDDATKMLAEANLGVGTVNEDWHEELAPGLVTATSAEPGEPMRRDAQIDLTLSKGPQPIRIANQSGRGADQAQANLEQAGFKVVVRTAHSPSVAAGAIISQNPHQGFGKRGDTITLVRSIGPALVRVPEIKALPTDQATKQLTDAGFKVETKPGENFLDIGYALRTDPPAGQQAPEGSTVTLFVL
ncbi:MAG: Stk1 family PASTA domain-containing Ser/Thr kinase [Propionibacteriaceae bacterium]|nr:Stk1 family PASTA domain-containing Ser/Thr kinase [Propionibacteriaceae bacterium]